MGISCDDDDRFSLGSLVVVTRGRHAGSAFVIIGCVENSEKSGKILIADGKNISVKKPKRKSARHIEPTGKISQAVCERLIRGKILDDGWLNEVVSRLKE